MGVWLAKFFSGFAFWQSDKVGKFIYHAIITLIVLALAWTVYFKTFLAKTYSTKTVIQHVDRYISQPPCPDKKDSFTLLKLWKFKILSLE